MTSKRLLVIALAVLAAALLVGFVGSASAHRAAPTPTTFTDPAGDANGAPDITKVVVSDDLASGMIHVALTQSGLFAISQQSLPSVIVLMNTDMNAATGQSGADYMLGYFRDPEGSGWDMSRYDGSTWQSMPQSATMSFSRSGDELTWHFSKNDIGGGKTGFILGAIGVTFDSSGNIAASDRAPDGGSWPYLLTGPARETTVTLSPVISKPKSVPVRAIAGKRLTVTFQVTRSDDSKPLTSGTLVATPKVAGKTIAHSESFKAGTARVSFVVPKIAKGKPLTVKVTIKAPSYKGADSSYTDTATGLTGTVTTLYSGQTASKAAIFRVK